MKRMLVLRPGAIGDSLLTFPVLKALRNRFDTAQITLVSNAQVLPLARAAGVAEQTFDFQDTSWSELFSSSGIRSSSLRDLLSQTDLAICWMRDPDGLVEHNLKTSGVKQVIIAPGRPPAGKHLHIVDYLAQTIGLPALTSQFISNSVGARVVLPALLTGSRRASAVAGLVREHDDVRLGGPLWSPAGGEYDQFSHFPTTTTKRFLAIHPGSGSVQKCWPIARFAQFITRLWAHNHPVLLLAGPADTELVRELLQQLSQPPAPEMFKMLTNAPLVEVAQHVRQSSCYLGNDSGITHLAAMLGVPTVALFGPTDPRVWRPIGPFVQVIHRHTLEDISVDAVIGCLPI